MRKLCNFLNIVFILLTSTGCLPGHLFYTNGPYRGQVIDTETREPIKGAAVLAVWHSETIVVGGGENPAMDYHNSLEVLTDGKGEFTVPRKTHFTFFGKIIEPDLIVYYPGYVPYPELHTKPADQEVLNAYKKHFFPIELPKLKTKEERKRYADIPPSVDSRVPEKRMRNMFRLINNERKELGFQPIGDVKGSQ